MSAEKPYVHIKDNKAEISIPDKVQLQLRVKTNSKSVQHVQFRSRSGQVDLEYSGSGEGNTIIGDAIFTGGEVFFATFEYFHEGSSVATPSKLNAGGPYDVGSYNLLVVVAENGDDSDYNDLILEITWYTTK